jgi:hypothetical protein
MKTLIDEIKMFGGCRKTENLGNIECKEENN